MFSRVAILFEGVIYPNTLYTTEDKLIERPMGGAIEFLTRLKDDRRIEPALMVATFTPDQVRCWLEEHGEYVSDIEIQRIPPANTYFMDCTKLFDGQFPPNSELLHITPWAHPRGNRRAG